MISHYHRLNGTKLVVVIVVAMICLFSALVYRGVWQNSANSAICQRVDILNTALQQIVLAGARDPEPGTYGYVYWRDHPGERADRGAGTHRIVVALRKAMCDP